MPTSRRRVLRAMSALALAGFARPPSAQHAAHGGATLGCTTRPLYLPRDAGFLGRLAPAGEPLNMVATGAGTLPRGLVHGPLGYRVRHRGRDYLNPTLVLHRGERVRIALDNRLDAPTIAHWHGLAVDGRNDGNGFYTIAPGQRYDYDFEVRDRGSLYWYHPHPHGDTARQTYGGLYGLIEVEDDDEVALRKALDLVPGRTEITLAMQDRRTLGGYAPTAADLTHGFFGDELAINGTPCPSFDAATRLYRFRMVNVCNARTLQIAFRGANGARVPFTLIGTDGGLLAAPVRAEQAFFATAERLDVLLDLRDASVGDSVTLETLAFDPMHFEVGTVAAPDHGAGHGAPSPATPADMHAAHHGGNRWPEGAARTLMTIRVRRRIAYDRRVPATLSKLDPLDVAGARERPLRLGFNKGRWRINDRVFVMGETPIEVARDSTEIWLLRNYHTSMPHAMHLHGFHFEVQERETSPDAVAALAIDSRGRLPSDLGRRDTVLVWPGESVRLAIRFAMPFAGPQIYVFHCHNLEHEDGGMMLGVKVG